MNLLRPNSNFSQCTSGSVVTIGNFDGVHLGHQSLLRVLKLQAEIMQLPLAVVIFEPQPREYFHKAQAPARILTFREKIEALAPLGVDVVFCVPFNVEIANTSAHAFIDEYLIKRLNVRYLLVGKDFRFGKNRDGDVAFLQSHLGKQATIQTHPDTCHHDVRVSSTLIRNALAEGNVKQAEQFLGRTYSIAGRVIRGDGRGRQWGIPTANIRVQRHAVPLNGVFVVQVQVDDAMMPGVANIGVRPTVSGGMHPVLEVHLLNTNQTLYGKRLKVFFLHKLRDEIKFNSIETLINQIREDIASAAQYFHTDSTNDKHVQCHVIEQPL